MKDSIEEMEQIQKNLEKYLEKELKDYQNTIHAADGEKEELEQATINDMDNMEENIESSELPVKETTKKVEKKRVKEHLNRKEDSFEKQEPQKKPKKPKPEKPEKKERRGKKKSGFKKVVIILAVIFLILGTLWYMLVGSIYKKMEYNPIESVTGAPMKSEGVINVLLIGSDARGEEEGRSDAMILLSVSQKTKTIHMTSLLRDMYVDIPGYKGNRLNAAYAYGGPELLMETIAQNLDIHVNRYVVVNFQTFANLVDVVGGVELELTNEEVTWVNAYLNEYNMLRDMPIETDYLDTSLSGMIHLNGPQALAYSRNRYIGTDFERTQRQRKVLTAVIGKLPSALIKDSAGVIEGIFSELTTNLKKEECIQLSLTAAKLLTYDIVQSSIPIEGSYKNASIRGMSVLEVDFEKNKEYVKTEIYGKK